MKLLYCSNCGDVVKLRQSVTRCECQASSGWYHANGLNASVVGDDARLLGFSNSSFSDALEADRQRPGGLGTTRGKLGWRFEAFVIPDGAETVDRYDKVS